ncbi:MAG: hypothetical protein EBR89_06585 [Betaproteobacteria bacterium]|nr:hypothetical protein [Betaproteobacteria bacterium]
MMTQTAPAADLVLPSAPGAGAPGASGGWLWHWRAWQAQSRWAATTQQIAQWLSGVSPGSTELLLIGASGGWMMSSAWLQRFRCVRAFDLDRWSAPVFRYRHGAALQQSRTKLEYQQLDAMRYLPQLLRTYPEAFVLFDNVLGQLRFVHNRLDAAEAQLHAITRMLRGREWASVHDAYSGRVAPSASGALVVPQLGPLQTVRQRSVAGALPQFSVAERRWCAQMGVKGAWLDHLTAGIFPAGTPIQHMAWPFSREYRHWLQAAWVRA